MAAGPQMDAGPQTDVRPRTAVGPERDAGPQMLMEIEETVALALQTDGGLEFLMVNNMTLHNGMELKATGLIRPHARGFSINVGHSEADIALHFNPRFNVHGGTRDIIILNSKHGHSWNEEQRDGNFPFEQGQEFEVTIVLNFDTFDIHLSNGHKIQFPNRFGAKKFKCIFFRGDAIIQDISVKPSSRPTKR
ncbi:galactose-binding lectin l-1-like [Conger conger]|uniref:galactose-binding lectin l-1-like n=1 Tax=Conger conger TaxID=82655 RepID=UPI002A5A4EA1|nr:galactose-binding lectin l-1-like [Conger conger]